MECFFDIVIHDQSAKKEKRRSIRYYKALEMLIQKKCLKTIEQNISIIHE